MNVERQPIKPKGRNSSFILHRSSLKQQRSTFTTLAFYKPYGVLSCFTDPAGRPTLAGYIPVPNVYPAGRLDYDTEGLLLLTADGALAHHITDPRHKLPKVYLVQVERDRKSTRLNSSHGYISYAVFCLKKNNTS